MNMDLRFNKVANGLRHRLVSMLPGLLAVAATAFDHSRSDQSMTILPVLGSIVLMVLGFMAPMILTEGFEKPIPSARDLAIGSKRFHQAWFAIGFCLLFGPGVVRLVARLLGAV